MNKTNPYSRYSENLVCGLASCAKAIKADKGMWIILYPVETVFCSKECRDKFVKEEKEKKSA